MSLLSLGAITNMMDDSFSGFDLPGNAQVFALLSPDVASVGNAVIQSSALGLRQATLEFYAEDDDARTARGYYEQKTQVAFTDFDGSSSAVVVLEFSRTLVMAGLWKCSATLVEMAEPTPPGS